MRVKSHLHMGWFIWLCHTHTNTVSTLFLFFSFPMCISHVMRRITYSKRALIWIQQQIANDMKYFFVLFLISVSLLFRLSFVLLMCVGKTWMLAPDQSHSLDILLSGDSLFELLLWWGCVFLPMPVHCLHIHYADWNLLFLFSSSSTFHQSSIFS